MTYDVVVTIRNHTSVVKEKLTKEQATSYIEARHKNVPANNDQRNYEIVEHGSQR